MTIYFSVVILPYFVAFFYMRDELILKETSQTKNVNLDDIL